MNVDDVVTDRFVFVCHAKLLSRLDCNGVRDVIRQQTGHMLGDFILNCVENLFPMQQFVCQAAIHFILFIKLIDPTKHFLAPRRHFLDLFAGLLDRQQRSLKKSHVQVGQTRLLLEVLGRHQSLQQSNEKRQEGQEQKCIDDIENRVRQGDCGCRVRERLFPIN